MDEWQPVRIAPSRNKTLCGATGEGLPDWKGTWEHLQGMVVRVRRVPVEICIMDENDKEAFEIHPDDIRKLGIEDGSVFCEHQILAD